MTERELRERMTITRKWYGSYLVEIKYRGKWYRCVSHNSLAYDMRNWEPGEPRSYYSSAKQALKSLYDECKRFNGLD